MQLKEELARERAKTTEEQMTPATMEYTGDEKDALIQTLQEEVSTLQGKVSELVVTRTKLQANLHSRDGRLDKLAAATKTRLAELERFTSVHRQELEAEEARCKQLELELEKARGLLDIEKKKTQTLEVSEGRAQRLLESERQRCETF